jgi:hypothetical protein
MTFDEFLATVKQTEADKPHWRRGQTVFNVLYQLRPDLAERIRTTDLDPFYLDNRVPWTLAWIEDEWDKPQ